MANTVEEYIQENELDGSAQSLWKYHRHNCVCNHVRWSHNVDEHGWAQGNCTRCKCKHFERVEEDENV